jgi:hypothetical protein
LKESKGGSGGENQDGKVADLMNNYRELEREYSQAVNELSELREEK